jgi:hypothetical protein
VRIDMKPFLKAFRPEAYIALLEKEAELAAMQANESDDDDEEDDADDDTNPLAKSAREKRSGDVTTSRIRRQNDDNVWKGSENAAAEKALLRRCTADAQQQVSDFLAERARNISLSHALDGEQLVCNVCTVDGARLAANTQLLLPLPSDAVGTAEMEQQHVVSVDDLDKIVVCQRCCVAVHCGCYGVVQLASPQTWMCDRCEQKRFLEVCNCERPK